MIISPLIGIIGGSGLYQMNALKSVQSLPMKTPFGMPSSDLMIGELADTQVAFLARHGHHHHLLPHEVPYQANIYAMKELGVRYLLSVSAVGSLAEDIRPLDIVLPDQFIDMTRRRESTFFGQGAIAHVSMAQPVCKAMTRIITRTFQKIHFANLKMHSRGTYICIEGPAFSTYAESQWFRSMGAHIIGMTNMPEAKLAKEAQLAYATIGLVTDYDCWHPKEAHVTADTAIANLKQNALHAQRLLYHTVQLLAETQPASAAHTALEGSLVTQPMDVSDTLKRKLGPLLPPSYQLPETEN